MGFWSVDLEVEVGWGEGGAGEEPGSGLVRTPLLALLPLLHEVANRVSTAERHPAPPQTITPLSLTNYPNY